MHHSPSIWQQIGGGARRSAEIPRVAVQRIHGPPKLPPELRYYIVQLAALQLYQQHLESQEVQEKGGDSARAARGKQLLQLACVERLSSAFVLNLLLHAPTLAGTSSVKSFTLALMRGRKAQNSDLMLRSAATTTKRLCIRHPRILGAEIVGARAPHLLFEATRITERTCSSTIAMLQALLPLLPHLESLLLSFPPRAFCASTSSSSAQDKPLLLETRQRLKELTCTGTAFGGDVLPLMFLSPSHWSNLTHLQLHGPRNRLTLSVCQDLGRLPTLHYIGLSMPHLTSVVDADGTSLPGSSILQPLINAPSRIKVLLVVLHDMSRYVGGAKVKPFVARLTTNVPVDEEQPRIKLVTAHLVDRAASPPALTAAEHLSRPESSSTSHVHPNTLFEWYVRRAERGTHWCFPTGDAAVQCMDDLPCPPGVLLDAHERVQVAARIDESFGVTCEVEEWTVPSTLGVATPDSPASEPLPDVPLEATMVALQLGEADVQSDSEDEEDDEEIEMIE